GGRGVAARCRAGQGRVGAEQEVHSDLDPLAAGTVGTDGEARRAGAVIVPGPEGSHAEPPGPHLLADEHLAPANGLLAVKARRAGRAAGRELRQFPPCRAVVRRNGFWAPPASARRSIQDFPGARPSGWLATRPPPGS